MEVKRAFDFIYWQKEQYPLNVCLSHKQDGKWVSFSTDETIKLAKEIGMGLIAMGLQPGDKVAIISANRPEWNLVDLGAQQAGLITVPMYPTIGVDDYQYIFQHSGVKVAFAGDTGILSKVQQASQGTDLQFFTFDKIAGVKHWSEVQAQGAKSGQEQELENRSKAVKHEDLCTIIYTSGTTGRPKGVMLSHQNVVSNAIGVSPRMPLPKGTGKALSFLPLCHIYERTGIYVYMYLGVSVYYAESMEKIGDNLKEVNPHTFNTVPRLLEKVYDKIVAKGNAAEGIKKKLFFWALDLGLKYEPHQNQGAWYNFQLALANKIIFSKWREALGGNIIYISCGSAALQARLARVFWAGEIKIVEGYGLTETSPVITASVAKHHDMRIGCVGPLIEGVEVKIAEDGEILCKGPNVMMGYYKDPEKTAEVLVNGWFHTGDIGTFVEGRYLKITDRKKEMFKTSGGKYVAPQIVENKFKESMLIEQMAVVGENRKYPAALIVPSFEALELWCKEEGIPYGSAQQAIQHPKVIQKFNEEVKFYNEPFGQWERIKQFKLMPELWSIEGGELTPTLKLKRKIIEKKYEKEIEAMYAGGGE